ncbi:hypothetical protein QVD17_23856 [Tagetes erecta]|uniref:Cysteine-rich receptor-like protein kinase n=1 Tax=Tagetes erecta TaxID=13708 RepID=A0AAD8KHJ2_TARER|nr:hypothetical protein QVD17_23856 [Tagetes erecta]
MVLATMAEQVTSQPTNRNSSLIQHFCSSYYRRSPKYFLSNLNTTFSSLHQQLISGLRYATAHTLFNGESVWAVALCRGYVSIPNCLDCFDFAVSQLKVCGLGNGGSAFYSDCHLRYENYDFLTQANNMELAVCDNKTAPQPKTFQNAGKRLLIDLQIAAPRTTNFYAASSKVAMDNTTVYGFAECNPNVGQSACLQCLKLRSRSLYDCLPAISGRAFMDNGCFMRYDRTPFFGQNQTTDITSLLWDDSRKKRYIIEIVAGGVSFLLLVVAIFVWWRRKKNTSRGHEQDARELEGVIYYNYKHLELATNNFNEENIIGKGGFGEPKIADFGLARFQPENQSHVTTNFAGTLGYTAPEYILYGHLSDKVDTFSFGIVILEIISGRKCTYRNFDGSSIDCLVEYAWKLYETKNLMKLVDEAMDVNQHEEEHLMNIIKIALLCTQSPVSKRPTMSEVVLMLLNDPSLGERQLTRPIFIYRDLRVKIGSS